MSLLAQGGKFRVLVVATDTEFAEIRKERPDTYANMETADIDNVPRVTAALRNSPFDVHVIIDVPPCGPRAKHPHLQ